MKKISLIIALLMVSLGSFAQFSVSGTVLDGSNAPVPNQIVWVNADTMYNTTYYFQIPDTTDANGNYSVNIPGSTPPGTIIDVRTYACGNWYSDSVTYNNQMNLFQNFAVCGGTTFTVHGFVQYSNFPTDEAVVYMISQVYDSALQTTILTAVDSSYTDSLGHYSITRPNTYVGILKLKAALLPSAPSYSQYLPTYYDSSIVWNGGSVISIPYSSAQYNIGLIGGTNPGGPAFVGGDVMQGANKSTAVGDPLEGRILILTDAGNTPVAYTHSDVNGHFEFPSVAYGTYHLFGDAMGRSNPILTFTLDANLDSITTINFWENDEEFVGYLWPASVATAPELNDLKVYPNPATDVVSIVGLDAINGTKMVTISSVNGAVVFSGSYQQSEKVSIPVTELGSGMYMLEVATEKGSSIYKIVK
ncbi:MAG TPA: T9SS type A sorting domain-containing protein [Flavipsychrobacter sp.]|nr:T9SS type A sorting domain-containing protein [Flavipsychrobacter sp.]